MIYKKLSELVFYMQRGISPKYSESGIPVINQKCIRNGQLIFEGVKFHSKTKKYSTEKTLKSNDILINSTGVGTLGRVARISKLNQITLADSHVTIVRPDVDKVDPLFLYYVLRLSEAKIVDLAAGSTGQTELSRELLGELQIPLFELSVQEYIGKNINFIDEKIKSNQSLSKNLEDFAQTIFNSWFVDFNPVKAKMNGESPMGMGDETAALFPDSFEESELGLIPKGWEIKKVEEILERYSVKGLAKSTELMNQGKTLVLEQGESVIAGFIDAEPAVIANADSPFFIFGDHTCRMRISTIPFSIFPNTIVLNSKIRDSYWAFGATNGLQRFETYRRHWMELAYKLIVVPNRQLTCTYGDIVKPYFEMVDLLLLQNRLLISLRDALLPRLISGELEIPEEMLAS